jgi:hypothetical protein
MKLTWLARRFWLCVVSALCFAGVLPAWAQSQSYVNSSETYNWIDASTHNRIRAYSSTYTYPENSTSAAVTISVASPGVVTWPAHGLAANTIVNLSTTGALPTGYTAGTTYYVRNPTATTFQLSASSGGASINTTGVQSGVHTARALTSAIAFPRTGPPYFLYTPTGSSCAGAANTIDDKLSDEIDIGFTFRFGGVSFTKLRVNSNGRVQFNNNRTCGAGTDNGTPTIYTFDYPDAGMNYSMRIYGADLDSTPRNFRDGAISTSFNPTYATSCLDDAQCYISVATIGTAPTRRFVITWNNVPKWVNAGLIAGNFNLQIILEEGGDFVYQFGLVADTQPNVPAQIGWQVNTNDFDIKQTALPTNNSAIRYTLPRPLLQYQMEQSSWSTAAGQVIDTSGNSYHGTRMGNADTTASGYSCNGANIPANGSSGVIDGINTSFNLLSQMGGAGTITFWYKPNTWVGASAAAVDGQLLDASNATNAWFYLSKLRVSNTTTKLRFAVRDTTGTTRVIETAAMSTAVLNAGGWIHIGLSWNFNTLPGSNQDRLRIYINGSAIGAGNSVQSLFTTAGALAAGIDTLTIGDNRSSFIDGVNGTGNSANGVIDEFRLYNLEAGVSQIVADFNQLVGCGNHYAITHSGSGATPVSGRSCVPNTVTIEPHTVLDVPIASAATISVSTSTGQGTWTLTTGSGTFTPGPANSGNATYRFNNENRVVLALSHTNAAMVNINVTDGTFTEKAGAEDADLNVVFCTNPSFTGCEYTSGRCSIGTPGYDQLFTKLAGRGFKLDAMAISLSNTLESGFNGTVAVDLLANTSPMVVSPLTNCPASQISVIPLGNVTFVNGRFPGTGVAVAANAFASVAPNYSAYRDVRMRFTCNATHCPPSGATVCSRDAFAVRPADFSFAAGTTGAPSLSLLNPASVTSGANRVTAGAAFNVTAQALTAASPAANALGYNGTPRIPSSIAAQSVSAQSSAVVTLTDYTDRLSDGDNDPTIALFTSATTSSGQAGGQLYYLDYGGFRVLAGGLQDPSYVDPAIDPPATDCVANSSTNADQDADPDRERFGCVIASQNNSALIGRFSPARFVLNSSSITSGCPAGGFTYEGQPFSLAFTASAMTSPVGTVLPNGDVMPRYTAGTVAVGAENSNDGVNRSARVALNLAPAPVWTNGVYVTNAPAATFSRPVAPDGPFDALDLGVQIADIDGASLWAARNMRPTDNTACTPGTATTNGTCTHQKLAGSPIKMRYGRLRMRNAYGSELLPLPMSLTAEYWTTTGWVTNTLDGCTSVPVPTSAGGMVFGAGNLSAGETVASINGTTTGNGTLIAGDAGFRLTAPGAGNDGFVTITITTPDWLEFPWVTAGVNADASARATFGIFKSPLIYRRENY